MKFLIQRVKQANVTVDKQSIGSIEHGLLIFVGVCDEDTTEIANKLLKKAINLRIFQDENDKTNLSLQDVKGSILIVSQFTLYADCRKGNRPSFMKSGSPDHARSLYEYIISECKKLCANVQTGSFGAAMEVSLINDGPFTIILDSKEA